MSEFITESGIRARMNASGQIVSTIADEFITVEQLLTAVEGDDELELIDGIGPKTAEAIEDWYENREDRERKAKAATVNRTSSTTLTVKNNGDWSDAIGIDTEADDA